MQSLKTSLHPRGVPFTLNMMQRNKKKMFEYDHKMEKKKMLNLEHIFLLPSFLPYFSLSLCKFASIFSEKL